MGTAINLLQGYMQEAHLQLSPSVSRNAYVSEDFLVSENEASVHGVLERG